ncbi:hypothetical protein ES702_06750 [subsurface metagenome]
MPQWSFPVSLPKFTDEAFEAKQQAYVAKHGYYVTAPKLEDIIHVRTFKEPSHTEWTDFKTSHLARTNPYRHKAIIDLLDRKRARRDRMMASPVPTWAKNLASVMTLFDDINDTLGTVGVIMRTAARLMPKTLGRFMLGPVGWLFLAAEIAGLFLAVMRLPFQCFTRKRTYEAVRDLNPFSKEAKIRRARKVRRLRPSKGELLELLQTTDNVFGIGLCLGPIMGFAYDVLSGTVRTVMGQEVHWGTPPPTRPKHTRPSSRLIRNAAALHGAGEEMTDEDHLGFMIALNGATQLLKPYIDEWHPLDQVDNFDNVLFEAPRPEHPTTKFILEEVGIKEGQAIGWPGLDKDLVNWEELWDHTQATAAKRFTDFAVRNRNNYVGACGCQNGDEFGMNMMLMTEGYDTVEYQQNDYWKGYYDMMATGCELNQCSSFARGGAWPAFTKTHAIPMGHNWIMVTASSFPHRYWKGAAAGGWLQCKDCKIYIGTAMGPAGFHRWIVAAEVIDEELYLYYVRKRIIR